MNSMLTFSPLYDHAHQALILGLYYAIIKITILMKKKPKKKRILITSQLKSILRYISNGLIEMVHTKCICTCVHVWCML